MDRKILTQAQQLRVTMLLILENMNQDEEISNGICIHDISIAVKNREWLENGKDGLALVESQVNSD